jgi:plasmid stability protein
VEDKLKIIRIRNIPPKVHEAIKIQAIKEGKSMEALVLELVEAYLTKKEGKR